jgi:molecular chaperone HtpG
MTTETQKQTFGFQTEVKQLLHLMIHSLYSHKEIFLRELISNASDAADKLRFEALAKPELLQQDSDLHIQIEINKDGKLLTIRDNGIGMSREEVVENLGTIAKSGTKKFLESLNGEQVKDARLIGQFGVGFYSVFMVADKVVVLTRRAGQSADAGVRWESAGDGEYSVESQHKPTRGTEIIIHLKEDAAEYLDNWHVRQIINKYSDHISLPIQMKKQDFKDGQATELNEWETVNKAAALWARPKTEITEQEYQEFYQHLTYDMENPLSSLHYKVEGKHEYTSLLYIPSKAPFDLWDRERKGGVKLYVKRVFIMDNAELLPTYLRFVKGVIDADDLPLNVSREILQHNKVVESMRSAITKKLLSTLEKMAKSEPEQYQKFWDAFGNVLKEGPAEDHNNREQLAKLFRFASTHTDSKAQTVSLDDYIARMKPEQKHIYYVTAENFAAAQHSPHLEIFRKKGVEVLLLADRVDEWLMAHLTEYNGKTLQSVAKGSLDLSEIESSEDKAAVDAAEKDYAEVLKQVKDALGERVKEVRLTHRLTDSPSCVVVDQYGMSLHLQRLMAAAGQNLPSSKPTLELNPTHRLVQRLKDEQSEVRFTDLAHVLLDQALLAEGGQLEDSASFVRRINSLL